ncbi:MAG: lipid II:glycine glycyltransferase FemX [Actinomycetota bacterium]
MTAGSPAPSTVLTVDAATDPLWEQVALRHESDVFHSPDWAGVLADTYGFDVRANVVMVGTDPVAGMAYVEVDDARGRRLISLPFSDFCDPLVEDGEQWAQLEAMLPVLEVPVTLRCLRRPVDGARWQESGSFAWHRIDVRRPLDEAWADLHASARRAIRKARGEGVVVVPAESESDLRAFFEMHLQVRKHKYGLLAQPYRFFQSIWERFLRTGEGHLLLAKVEDRVVGGVLFLRWKETLYYKFNASDPGRLGVRPNDLLLWEGLTRAHESGLEWVDFGVSDWDQEGLIRYKEKYATESGQVRKISSGPGPDDRLGSLLGSLTAVLTDPSVPDATTERAGDLLYGLFC